MLGDVAPLIHIGYHKTATTFLQKELFTDTGRFVTPWGPQSGQAIEHFVLEHPRRFDPDAIRAKFLAACRDTDRVPVISHENLSGSPAYGRYDFERTAARIAACFPEARILIGIREQVSILHSLYLQYVAEGGTQDIVTMLEKNRNRIGFRPLLRLDFFEYDLMLDTYRQHFPAEQILIQPIELLRTDPNAYLDRLGRFLELEWPPSNGLRRVNERQSEVTMALRRLTNSVIRVPAERPRRYADYPLLYRMRNRLLRQFDATLRRHMPARYSAHSIRERIAGFVGDYFAASNGRLEVMTGLDLQGLHYPSVLSA